MDSFSVMLSIITENYNGASIVLPMKQHILKIVNNCLNTNIYSYLETSGVQTNNIFSNAVNLFNTSVN
jgi:hypothetical protein